MSFFIFSHTKLTIFLVPRMKVENDELFSELVKEFVTVAFPDGYIDVIFLLLLFFIFVVHRFRFFIQISHTVEDMVLFSHLFSVASKKTLI